MNMMKSNKNLNLLTFIMIVLLAKIQSTYGQSYLLSLGQNQQSYINRDMSYESVYNVNSSTVTNISQSAEQSYEFLGEDFNSTADNVINNILSENSSDLPDKAMDVVTIVWYIATFAALATFFLLMTCPTRRCGANDGEIHQHFRNRNDLMRPPLTPTPSYSEFAPPSYDSVMKMEHDHKTSIFVIPFSPSVNNLKEYNALSMSNNDNRNTLPETTPASFYVINEVQKY